LAKITTKVKITDSSTTNNNLNTKTNPDIILTLEHKLLLICHYVIVTAVKIYI